MRTELFDYQLPERLIAQRPAGAREQARLLVLRPGGFEHRSIADLPQLLPQDALIVLNQTRVRKARLIGHRAETSGRVELLLLEAEGKGRWLAIGKANRPLRVGDRAVFGELAVEIIGKRQDGTLEIEMASGLPEEAALRKDGLVPLPPYIQRDPDDMDDERYQTVFARELGSVAAPTAGLHFSKELLDTLSSRGIELGFLTLHVGIGTFRPVTAENLEQHVMHAERVVVSEQLAAQVARAKQQGRPVVAVGTTVVRALESAARAEPAGRFSAFSGSTRLFIKPGYDFRIVDALLTNFHMPRSTLLALVAAFAGYDLTMRAYQAALAHEYRFLSYGDAMWIPEYYGRSS